MKIVADFSKLFIPSLPGVIAYLAAKPYLGSSLWPILIGMGVLLCLFPLTLRITEHISEACEKMQ